VAAALQHVAAAGGRVRVFPVLVGASERDRVALHEAETASSVLAETAGPRHPATPYPMTTIDRVVAEHFAGRPPDLLKLDVQGYELEVLKGAEGSLPGIGAIVAEINLLDLHREVPLLADVVAWLAARGFVAYDVGGLIRRPLDNALWQMDMVFVPTDSPLRCDKRWSSRSPGGIPTRAAP
jgi:FkbM family methyltransferase